jgi:hypothetical protein
LGAPIWTPDGARVLYESGSTVAGRPDGIWIVNVDGSGQRSLAEGFAITARVAPGSAPRRHTDRVTPGRPTASCWSSATFRNRFGKLFTIDGDGSNLSELADCLCQFDWQPIFK